MRQESVTHDPASQTLDNKGTKNHAFFGKRGFFKIQVSFVPKIC